MSDADRYRLLHFISLDELNNLTDADTIQLLEILRPPQPETPQSEMWKKLQELYRVKQ